MFGKLLTALALIAATSSQPARRLETAEQATARRFDAIKNDPLRLRAFLTAMPKGGDLHNHLSGAIYAESYLSWAAEDGLCLATATYTIAAGACDESAGRPPVSAVLRNTMLFNQAVDAMSMRNWNPTLNGHDHFFATFAKFGPASLRTGDMLAEVTRRAASEGVSYLELMVTPDRGATVAAMANVEPDPDPARWREKLLAAGLRDTVLNASRRLLDAAEARRRELLGCSNASPAPDACEVTVRYIAQVGRTGTRPQVFTQMVAWFELASAEPRVVSLNLVQPEGDPTSVADFMLHMSWLDVLHKQYPNVPITLHAGELAEGVAPTNALRFHIRQSIERGHAQRIGHGVSVIHEDDPFGLLRDMAARKVLVEIGLSSNDIILGVRGKYHPLRLYLEYGVPVAIATDDMGVSRSSHTREFVKAVEEHGLDYATLKKLARNSIDYSFADAATKAKLRAALDEAFDKFERLQQQSRS